MVGFDLNSVFQYSTMRNILEARGLSIGSNDLLILSIVKSRDDVPVTNNVKEISRIPDLKLEKWYK
ncbi:MAG: hypothetical protein K9I99_12690 [Melioribacteraceae bacterium]|nr:hypothetical protein [Melioribacteraceae bacterium]MCF8430491.1 hypothetical protein [Melioribacteraceae bacterium]